MYEEFAREVAVEAQRAVVLRMSIGAPYARLEEIAQLADTLAFAFSMWATDDPGLDARQCAVAKLTDMRAEAKAMGADL